MSPLAFLCKTSGRCFYHNAWLQLGYQSYRVNLCKEISLDLDVAHVVTRGIAEKSDTILQVYLTREIWDSANECSAIDDGTHIVIT